MVQSVTLGKPPRDTSGPIRACIQVGTAARAQVTAPPQGKPELE